MMRRSEFLSEPQQRFFSDLVQMQELELSWPLENSLPHTLDPSVASARRSWLIDQCARQIVRAQRLRAVPKTPAVESHRGPIALPTVLQRFALDVFNADALRDSASRHDVRKLLRSADADGRRRWLLRQCAQAFVRARARKILPLQTVGEAAHRKDWPPSGEEMLDASGYEIRPRLVDPKVRWFHLPEHFDHAKFTTVGVRWVSLPYKEDPRVLCQDVRKRGFAPASIEHLLAYGAVTPFSRRRRAILLLDVWGATDSRNSAYVYADGVRELQAMPCSIFWEGRVEQHQLSNVYSRARREGYWIPVVTP